MITALLLATTALAAPDGYKPTKDFDDCQLYAGPKMSDGVQPVMAECSWPEFTVEQAEKQLVQGELHDDIFRSVTRSDKLPSGNYRQTHQASGISDRELIVSITRSDLPGGGFKLLIKDQDEPFDLTEGNVKTARDITWWEIRPREGGGIDVTYYMEYDPGGRVPDFIVRSFQTGGVRDVVNDLRAWLKRHK